MATATPDRDGDGVSRSTNGALTGDGTVLSVYTGFRPHRVTIFNLTDATTWEKIDGMLDTQTIKTVTAGTMTTDTTSAIVFNDRGFTATAALFASGKAIVWHAV